MSQVDTIIIGAGQAGLAISHCLGSAGIDHIVLERGRPAERWHHERWDLLRLLTPNWMSRLPGWNYQGDDPDGFMTKRAFAGWLEQYAAYYAAPIVSNAPVRSVRRVPRGYLVESGRGTWRARCVVVATGYCDVPLVPEIARGVPTSIRQITSVAYRNIAELPEGGVLVVGASASGVQIAEEIRRSGRSVVIAAGAHTRIPRLYRGRDIMWWLDRSRRARDAEAVAELSPIRDLPSMQLVGRSERTNIDLRTLRKLGVQVVGRAAAFEGGRLGIDDDLSANVATAQARLERMLARIDALPEAASAPPEAWPDRLTFDTSPTSLDLAGGGIRTIVWATGFKRDYRWLNVPVLDAAGEIIHRGGVTPSPGLYVTGLRFLRRWNPSFIDAVSADAAELAAEVKRHFSESIRAAA